MRRYANLGGDSNVVGYEFDSNSIRVLFGDGSLYEYTCQSAGMANVERMIELAEQGEGLNSFIMRYVYSSYARVTSFNLEGEEDEDDDDDEEIDEDMDLDWAEGEQMNDDSGEADTPDDDIGWEPLTLGEDLTSDWSGYGFPSMLGESYLQKDTREEDDAERAEVKPTLPIAASRPSEAARCLMCGFDPTTASNWTLVGPCHDAFSREIAQAMDAINQAVVFQEMVEGLHKYDPNVHAADRAMEEAVANWTAVRIRRLVGTLTRLQVILESRQERMWCQATEFSEGDRHLRPRDQELSWENQNDLHGVSMLLPVVSDIDALYQQYNVVRLELARRGRTYDAAHARFVEQLVAINGDLQRHCIDWYRAAGDFARSAPRAINVASEVLLLIREVDEAIAHLLARYCRQC